MDLAHPILPLWAEGRILKTSSAILKTKYVLGSLSNSWPEIWDSSSLSAEQQMLWGLSCTAGSSPASSFLGDEVGGGRQQFPVRKPQALRRAQLV